MPTILKHGVIILILAAFLVCISYFYLDKSLAFFTYSHNMRQYLALNYISQLALIFVLFSLLIFPYAVIRFAYQRFLFVDRFLLTFATSIAVTFFLKEILKQICSRYWPMSWQGNLSLINNGVYGFNWFQFSSINNSFPSGHAAVTFAGLTAIAHFFPRIIWSVYVVGLSVVIAILALYYHFLSDVIAGAALGYLTTYYILKLMKEKV